MQDVQKEEEIGDARKAKPPHINMIISAYNGTSCKERFLRGRTRCVMRRAKVRPWGAVDEVGLGCLWVPSYVVSSTPASMAERSTCLRTWQLGVVHL